MTQTEPATTSTTALAATSTETLPDHIVLTRGPQGLAVASHRKPTHGELVLLGAFTAVWDVVWAALVTTAPPNLFWFSHGAVALGLTATLINNLVNHTSVELSQRRLLVRRRPLPWPGRVDVAIDDVAGFTVAQGPAGGRRRLWYLWVVLRSGKQHKLLQLNDSADPHGEEFASVLRRAVDEARAR